MCQQIGNRFANATSYRVMMKFIRNLKAKMAPETSLHLQNPLLLSPRIITYVFEMAALNVITKLNIKKITKFGATRLLGLLTCDYVDIKDDRVHHFICVSSHTAGEAKYLKRFYDSIPKNSSTNYHAYIMCRFIYNHGKRAFKISSSECEQREIKYLVEKMIFFNDNPVKSEFDDKYVPNPTIFESASFKDSEPVFTNVVKTEQINDNE